MTLRPVFRMRPPPRPKKSDSPVPSLLLSSVSCSKPLSTRVSPLRSFTFWSKICTPKLGNWALDSPLVTVSNVGSEDMLMLIFSSSSLSGMTKGISDML
ncbi:hypothetical protein D3C84_982390 [compost metagenome]